MAITAITCADAAELSVTHVCVSITVDACKCTMVHVF